MHTGFTKTYLAQTHTHSLAPACAQCPRAVERLAAEATPDKPIAPGIYLLKASGGHLQLIQKVTVF